MKTRRWLLVAPLVSLFAYSGYGQITIQKTDVQQYWGANTSVKLYSDTSHYVNVGKTGGVNVYDFSSLVFPDSTTYTLYPSSQIAQLAPRFNSSSLVWGSSPQAIDNSPVYFFTDTSFVQLAGVSIFPDSQTYSYEMIPLLQFPATYNLQWNRPNGLASEIIDSTYVDDTLIYHATISGGPKNYTIDGYGTLMVKGQSYQCLRVKEIDPNSTDYYRFSYFTKEGVSIFIDSYQSQSDTGIVEVEDVYCTRATGIATLVPNNKIVSAAFSLSQNYPNPFNPSTMIQFIVPSNGRAVLKVFNVLGQEVATLFNGEVAAGVNHQVEFNASNLASGVYFSRLEFGGNVQMNKMLLLK